jgi:CelD/BcsL family acetyltransferase involved in cellulose biosynthesis
MNAPTLTRVELTKIDQLSTEAWAFWSNLQRADANLESPFFRPEFVRLVSTVRDDVEVALLYDEAELVGIFPFQRDAHGVAIPAGGWFSDYHGAIAIPGLQYTPQQLLALCGLAAWYFNHLPQTQTVWQPYRWNWIAATSPYLDLSAGFAAYRSERKKAHSELLEQTLRKARKMQREIGPVKLVERSCDPRVLETLLEWKIAQYREMGVRNYLGPPWALKFVRALSATSGEHFSGRLSALYAGDRLAAINLSVQAGGVWHALVMAYNQELARYSPGLVLLAELAQQCESLGLRKLDLGRGTEPYKARLMSGEVPLLEGALDLRVWPNLWRRGFSRGREAVRSSPFGDRAQQAVRTARGWFTTG